MRFQQAFNFTFNKCIAPFVLDFTSIYNHLFISCSPVFMSVHGGMNVNGWGVWTCRGGGDGKWKGVKRKKASVLY
ncbi:MAG: hypothetical protein AAGC65_15090 [Mucilaginibacter sp.]|uniref:hypothetical protein n=1 Tax=Mucilaginibacter sp. TaxID=1882438 RepID=UPI0031A9F82F